MFHAEQVLLLKRFNPPHQGLWTAPGGKIEFGESLHDCCIREVYEETGIHITMPDLCAIQTVVDVAIPIQWQLFIFRTTLTEKIVSQNQPEHNEGELRWVGINDLSALDRPYTDMQYWDHVRGKSTSLWRGKFVYDTPHKLVEEYIYSA
jgi:8-oxo-dGTP diphosphatase